jgi:hypothetical protein
MINSEDAGNNILRNIVNYTPNNTTPSPSETSATLLHIPASQINQARKPTSLTFLMIFFSRPKKFLDYALYETIIAFV